MLGGGDYLTLKFGVPRRPGTSHFGSLGMPVLEECKSLGPEP